MLKRNLLTAAAGAAFCGVPAGLFALSLVSPGAGLIGLALALAAFASGAAATALVRAADEEGSDR
ncbi:MAG TPA: hypothetical protein DEH78_14930 [Solibacterales bacterium]|nr:hypothetical protein [Bryobacterales bacterium]